jgi:hypothetical protein
MDFGGNIEVSVWRGNDCFLNFAVSRDRYSKILFLFPALHSIVYYYKSS